jgi:hypothetical protein
MKLKTLSTLILSVSLLTACMPDGSVGSTPTEGGSKPVTDTVPAPAPSVAIPTTGSAPVPTKVALPTGSSSEPAQAPVELTPAQRAAIQALSEQHNIAFDQIKLVSSEAETWPDGCLGVALPDMMCTQALVDGFRILLSANGQEYEYRTNLDGSLVYEATQLQLAP